MFASRCSCALAADAVPTLLRGAEENPCDQETSLAIDGLRLPKLISVREQPVRQPSAESLDNLLYSVRDQKNGPSEGAILLVSRPSVGAD
jgi:hypothetical protein